MPQMAFETSQRLYHCRKCGAEGKYYQMMESKRGATRDVDEENGTPKWWRICLQCEREYRLEEIKQWSLEEIDKKPFHCDMVTIRRDKNAANKSDQWNRCGKHITEAKQKVMAKAEESGETLTRSEKKRAAISMAKELACAFVEALKHGDLMDVFRRAGDRMMNETAKAYEEYAEMCDKAIAAYDEDPAKAVLLSAGSPEEK